MIRTHGLRKRYGSLVAVDGIDLQVRPGEIYGLLGPNGAGKTSTLLMLLGVVRPTAGEILLFGEPYSPGRLDLRRRIGVVPEKHPRGVWSWMTAREYLELFARLFDIAEPSRRIGELLERVGLSADAGRRFHEFSGGMLQKLSFVRALLPDPDLLLLDEPISGLDPLGIKSVRDLIIAERRQGRTIVISSHQLSEMERLCDRVAIISKGRLLAEDALSALLARIAPEREILVDVDDAPPALAQGLLELPFVTGVEFSGKTLVIRVPREGDFRRALSERLIRDGGVPLRIAERSSSLEEVYLTITQDNVRRLTGESP